MQPSRCHKSSARPLLGCAALMILSCDVDLGPRTGQQAESFGAIVFREACQRVSYTSDLERRQKDPAHRLDPSGASVRAMCNGESMPESDAAPALRALFDEREGIIQGVDGALPEALLDPFDLYLRALTPLEDDGTVATLLLRSSALLTTMSGDDELLSALARVGRFGGMRPPRTAGGLLRSLTAAKGLDDFIGAGIPLLLQGGPARAEFEALLRAAAYELGRIQKDDNPLDPQRTPRLLLDLLFSRRGELDTGAPLWIAQRDHRGLPVLSDIVAPYVRDARTGLARADELGRFVDRAGEPIPAVSPLPELGRPDGQRRDADGRALRADGQPLYRYVNLDGTLLMALLRDGNRLFPKTPPMGREVDIALGVLPGAALLSGSRAMRPVEDSSFLYKSFANHDAVLLSLAHGVAQLMRFGQGSMEPRGKEIGDMLMALQTLVASAANEGPLSRSLKALFDAADEAKKPVYESASIPRGSTLYDDLAPILARVFAVPPRTDAMGRRWTLLEDLMEAMKDPHIRGLGAMTARLLDDRGYFFMRQPSQDSDYNADGLIVPAALGVVGTFGRRPDRARPDADTLPIPWRSAKTDEPSNNRSVMQRLLHMIADTNGRKPLCNGRNALFLGGLIVYQKECDLFQIDNVARFFLLSIASPSVRQDPSTFAKQAASFIEAVRNGRNCRGTSSDPQARQKCEGLIDRDVGIIPDFPSTDRVLEGIMRIKGFGRYPEPAAAARLFFLDLGDAASTPPFAPKRPKDMIFNHIDMGGMLVVDPADPDARKIPDGNGQDRRIIDQHNGVLFALEAVRGPATFPDGTPNPFPDDNFYDAMRPLVDAFARHHECFQYNMTGTCTVGQNAVQILADIMTVLHRHWPSPRSQVFGRSFAESYGPEVAPDGAVSYEPLAAAVMAGDLVPAIAELAPVLSSWTVDGQVAGQPALPLFQRFLRFVFDPSQAPPGGFSRRDGSRQALRNDGQPAYVDATLERLSGARQDAKLTPFYLLADAFREKRAIFDRPENRDARQQWESAISDAIDAFLKVRREGTAGMTRHRFDNPRIRPVSALLLEFMRGRVDAHKDDLGGWSAQLVKDLGEILAGPLYAGLVDLGSKLSADAPARRATYTLLGQLLDESQPATLAALAAALADGAQLLLADADLSAIGRGIKGALDPASGPVDPLLSLTKRGRDYELATPAIAGKQVLIQVMRNLFTPDRRGVYPMFQLSEAIAEVNRESPGAGGAFSPEDHRSLMANLSQFLRGQDRGMLRFISIVQSRCLRGPSETGCKGE